MENDFEKIFSEFQKERMVSKNSSQKYDNLADINKKYGLNINPQDNSDGLEKFVALEARKDVFKYDLPSSLTGNNQENTTLYFIPDEYGWYSFCTRNQTDAEKKIQKWMNGVRKQEVTLRSIGYVIRDAILRGLGKDVEGKFFQQTDINRQVYNFAHRNELPTKENDTVQIIGLAKERYIERTDDHGKYSPDSIKGEEIRYKLYAKDAGNHKSYIITLYESHGKNASGDKAVRGHMSIEKAGKGVSFSHKPITPITIKGFAIDPETLICTQRKNGKTEKFDVNAAYNDKYARIENNLFTCSSIGNNDDKSPNGYANIKSELFEEFPEVTQKRPVWIIQGNAATEDFIEDIKNLHVLHTGNSDKLPDVIYDDVIVLDEDSKFSLQDVKERLYGVKIHTSAQPSVMSVTVDKSQTDKLSDELRNVYILQGPKGTYKSTLAYHLDNSFVFNTDSHDELSENILADVVVLDNQSPFSLKDIKKCLYGDNNIIKMSFKQENIGPIYERRLGAVNQERISAVRDKIQSAEKTETASQKGTPFKQEKNKKSLFGFLKIGSKRQQIS